MAPPRNPVRPVKPSALRKQKSQPTQFCDKPEKLRPVIGVDNKVILPFCFPSSPFSNFYPARFIDGYVFHSALQYFAYRKAILFGDELMANSILRTLDARCCLGLGRLVANFDEEIWERKRFDIMHDAVYSKFAQNKELKEILMNTGNGILVETTNHIIWGAAISENDRRIRDPKLWPGQNLLGRVLMEVRMEFLVEEMADQIDALAATASTSDPQPTAETNATGPKLPIWNAYWSGRPRPTPSTMMLVFRDGCFGADVFREYPFRWKGKKFLSILQYLYYRKAELTEDNKIQRRLLQGRNGEWGIRVLGRRIRGLDADLWRQQVDRITFEGVYARFSQNPDLKQRLLDTDEALLCYADDNEWGVGMSLYDKDLNCPAMWKGPNRLGKALMTVRDMFREEASLDLSIK